MSFLQNITSGVSQAGLRIVLAAQEKMGKTTLCDGAPEVLLIPLEVGYAGVKCAKTPMITSLAQLRNLLSEIYTACQSGTFPFKTLAFDSATAIERLIHEDVISRDPLNGKKTVTMESAHGGYGKAYLLANADMSDILSFFDSLSVYFGINIILTCHVFSSKILDPNSGEYDCWDLLLHSPKNNKTYGKREIVTQWADIIGFIYEPMFVNESGKIAKAISQNKGRVIGMARTPSYVAGNRFGITAEISLPVPPNNGWNAVAAAIYAQAGIDVFNRSTTTTGA